MGAGTFLECWLEKEIHASGIFWQEILQNRNVIRLLDKVGYEMIGFRALGRWKTEIRTPLFTSLN